MRSALLAATLFFATTVAQAASSELVALVRDNELGPVLGRYDSDKGWMKSSDFFDPPLPQSPVTLYDVDGKVRVVTLTMPESAAESIAFKNWTSPVSFWTSGDTRVVLGVIGDRSATPRTAQAVLLDDAESIQMVRDYLADHHLAVAQPRITQNLKVDLEGDGTTENLICAHSDDSLEKDNEPIAIYALALVRYTVHGKQKVEALGGYAGYKPASEDLDEFQRRHGMRVRYQYIAFPDLTGNGKMQIALFHNYWRNQPTIRGAAIYDLTEKGIQKVLSAENY